MAVAELLNLDTLKKEKKNPCILLQTLEVQEHGAGIFLASGEGFMLWQQMEENGNGRQPHAERGKRAEIL